MNLTLVLICPAVINAMPIFCDWLQKWNEITLKAMDFCFDIVVEMVFTGNLISFACWGLYCNVEIESSFNFYSIPLIFVLDRLVFVKLLKSKLIKIKILSSKSGSLCPIYLRTNAPHYELGKVACRKILPSSCYWVYFRVTLYYMWLFQFSERCSSSLRKCVSQHWYSTIDGCGGEISSLS